MPHEAHVVVARELRHLDAEPRRARELLVLARELELGHDEPRVVAVELVDLPLEPAVLDEMPRLVDERPVGERQQLARVVGGIGYSYSWRDATSPPALMLSRASSPAMRTRTDTRPPLAR